MARAKNVARADARRRSRAAARDSATQTDLTEESTAAEPATAAEAPSARPFALPPVLDDIRALPDIFRQRPLVLLPFALIAIGFVLALGLPYSGLDPGIAGILSTYVSFTLDPRALLVFFLGGYLAPRASWLIGLLLGIVNAILFSIFALVLQQQIPAPTGAPPDSATQSVLALAGYAIAIGTLVGGFGGWYRRFLQRMNEQGRARRAARQAEQERKRREERKAGRRPPSS